MIVAALRDLYWRRRRIAAATLGTGLVLAMTMIMTGLSATFPAEASRFVDTVGADAYVVTTQAEGPFYGPLPLPESTRDAVAAAAGVDDAAPMLLNQAPVENENSARVMLVGVTIGGIGSPVPSEGSSLSAQGQAIVSTSLGKDLGDSITIGSETFEVVGTRSVSLFAEVPVAFVPLADAQAQFTNGAPIATSVATRGVPRDVPEGMKVVDLSETQDNLLAPLLTAQQTLAFMAVLLWIVAACVLASSMYLTATERSRDFAVFKATGVSNGSLMVGLAVQAAIISLVAAALGMIFATLLGPLFPVSVTITPAAYVALPAVALTVGLLASLLGMRKVASVDPAAAFAGP